MVSLLAGTGACVLGRHLLAGSARDKRLGRLQASLMLIATFAALATAETIAQTIALRVGDPENYFASWSATSCKRSFAPIAA